MLEARKPHDRCLFQHWRISSSGGMTALHEAAFYGRAVVVGVLLDNGAYIESRAVMILDLHTPTPLHIAARCGHVGVARVLIRRGANVDARTGDDRTALHLAQTYDNAPVVDVLSARNTSQQ